MIQQSPSAPRSAEASGLARFFPILAQDLRFSLRVLRKSPGFTVVAVLTLGLAIGANALVFAVMNALLLRPLDVPHAESLYRIDRPGEMAQAYPNYVDLRDRNRSFEALAADTMNQAVLDKGNDAAQGWMAEVSGNYFDVLEVQPALGRFFHASEEHGPNSVPDLVLSYGYWHSRFAGDPGVLGRSVLVNKHPFTIVGVAPPSFRGTLLFFAPDFYLPLIDQPEVAGWDGLTDRSNRWLFEMLGHLNPGITPAQALADLNAIGADLEKTYPKDVAHGSFELERPGLGGNFLRGPLEGFMAGLMLLAGLILLAACANLGSLFAARASDRSREVALRLALGSSRNRILRQLMTEAVLLGLAGGAVGLAGSLFLLHRLAVWQPFGRFPLHVPASPDARVYAVALLLALVSGLLFGLVPARQVLRADPYQIVKAGASARLGRRLTVRDLLLVVQIALCGVLVTASLVAVRGLMRSLHARYGFDPDHATVAAIDMSAAGYKDADVPAMQKRMIEALQTVPGVEHAATINVPPLAMGGEKKNVFRENAADLQAAHAAASPYMYPISPDYFAAAGSTLLAGRPFSWHDDAAAPRVAVVNQEFARQVFGSPAAAIGRSFRLDNGTRVEIVGLAEDGKYFSLTEAPQAAVFLPILQRPWGETALIVRSRRPAAATAAAIRQKLRDLDPGLAPRIQTWTSLLDFALFPSRMATLALGVLGLMGALLSVTGIFGMAAYSVSKRLRELGIRIALGAQRQEVLAAALGRALLLLALGSAAGLALGVLGSRVLAAVVYQATPRDPLVLAGVVLAMALLGLLATWIPAHRALGLDPLKLLREE